ncbi:MAG: N-acetyltransferase [Deltaproteobacteria bacterium]|nr:N-acetyltransferase [Deltaproteobacteria bacterium]
MIRKAQIQDVPAIYELLLNYSQKGLMLGRSLSELYERIRDFYITVQEGSPKPLAGTCALQICWEDLAEIRSLGVNPEFMGSDLGRRLLAACETEAVSLGVHRLFVLTYIPDYFEKIGYNRIEKIALPQKIWADCFKCIKFPECGEIAMEKIL